MLGRAKKVVFIAAGTSCVVVGVIGIFVPLLPTTPFLLLAAYLYSRSSDKHLRWLLSNRWFGKYLRGYREGHGVPLRVKVAALSTLWCTIGISGFLFVSSAWIRLLLLLIGSAVTIHILRIKTSPTESAGNRSPGEP